MATLDEKVSIEHAEAGEDYTKHHVTQDEIKHGDNALKYIGDERVEVTQEDVSDGSPSASVFSFLRQEEKKFTGSSEP